MQRLSVLLLLFAASVFAQYDDYPVGEYEYPHDRIVISPIKVVGGMDATKRDQGPKVDLVWVPGIDIQEIRYEHVGGSQGSFGWGPIVNVYLGLDSVKATSFAAGVYARLYAGLGTGSYVQMGLQYYLQTGTKLFDGAPHRIYLDEHDSVGTMLASTNVKVQGPQISPALGYQRLFGRKWILEGQMGITVGWYTVSNEGAPPKFDIRHTDAKGTIIGETYRNTSDWGGFFFAQIAGGYAF